MNREVLLELLSNKHRTFREVSASSGLRALRDEVARTRSALPSRTGEPSRPVGDLDDLDDARLEDIPEVAARLEHAHLYVVASFAGGDDQWVDAVADVVGGPAGLDAAALDRLVAERRLDETTARRVGFAAAVYEAVERDTALTRIVRDARFTVSNGHASSTLDLARTSREEWSAALGAAGPAEVGGRPIAEIAGVLADRFAAMHPGPAFIARLSTHPDDRIGPAIADAEPLFGRNAEVFSRSTELLDLSGLDPDRVAKPLAAHALLRGLVLKFPDLLLQKVLDDRSTAIGERTAILVRRLGYIRRIHQLVGEERILFLDYGPRSPDLQPLRELRSSPEETGMVLRMLKTHQRVFVLGGNAETATTLLSRGFSTARSISRSSLEAFRNRVGLGLEQASAVHARATRLAGDAAIVAASMLDVVNDPLAHTNAANVPPSALDYLRELDGFEQLFGSLSFCACEECNSILGPAAYFVDLMRFVDDHARPQFASHPDHALDLKTRRPDLWTLPLTCANTRDRLPVLQIVDEILEGFIARTSNVPGSPEEQRRQVYETLATTGSSFALPFHLPIAQIDAHLDARSTNRAEISRAMGQAVAEWAFARLGLTASERALITTPDADLDHHRARLGVDFQLAGAELAPVDVQELRRHLPIERDQLSALLVTAFVTGSGATPRIVAEKQTPDSLQNDIERVYGLTAKALDRMHRLVRLQRHVTWTLTELDGVLAALELAELDAAALVHLARVVEIQTRWSIPVEDARVLVGSASAVWLDGVFRSRGSDPLPDASRMFVHPAFRTAPTVDAMQTRLASALGASHDELEQLIRLLAPHLARSSASGFDPNDADEDQRGFVLSATNLTLLYRHVRIARLLHVSIPQLQQLCALAGIAALRACASRSRASRARTST